jgi:uncharacterized iron-regulated membrane protein
LASQRTNRILLALHSWSGIVTGLLLFVVCVSGSLVVFKHEIDLWANPQIARLPAAAEPVGVDRVLATLATAEPEAPVESVWLPDAVTPVYYAMLEHPTLPRLKVAVRADDASYLGSVDSELGQFLRSLHVFLFFGPRWIVGFLGVAMLVLIASGVALHRKLLRELYTLRWGRSLRLLASDLHKAAAVWGLVFHSVIALTGAWLGLAPLVQRGHAWLVAAEVTTPVTAEVATSAAARTKPLLAASAAHPAGEPASLDAVVARASVDVPGLRPTRVSFSREPGVTTAHVAGRLDRALAIGQADYRLETGELLEAVDPRTRGVLGLLDAMMEPLHFGDFGGLALKWLYFVMGLMPAVLSITGTVIWFERRRRNAQDAAEGGGSPGAGAWARAQDEARADA